MRDYTSDELFSFPFRPSALVFHYQISSKNKTCLSTSVQNEVSNYQQNQVYIPKSGNGAAVQSECKEFLCSDLVSAPHGFHKPICLFAISRLYWHCPHLQPFDGLIILPADLQILNSFLLHHHSLLFKTLLKFIYFSKGIHFHKRLFIFE